LTCVFLLQVAALHFIWNHRNPQGVPKTHNSFIIGEGPMALILLHLEYISITSYI
jgi:hypothetical protein